MDDGVQLVDRNKGTVVANRPLPFVPVSSMVNGESATASRDKVATDEIVKTLSG